MEFFMRVLTATEPDNVGGGLVFNGLFVVSNWNDRYNDFAGMGGGGGGIDVGPRGNGSNGGQNSSGAGYGANLVDPIACKADTIQAGVVGAAIGSAVGGFLGKGSIGGVIGGAVVGGLGGFLLGSEIGASNSPNCKPK
jgi:hypothetical protein